jgi:EmrB/QacA subfamily drug resistance transporter
MGALDTTIVLLALPTMTNALHTTLFASIWVILVYLLVIAVTTTQFGRIGDIYGRGRMFNLGFIIFTVGSLLCGLSYNIITLIIFRIIQAIGGSLLQANSGAIIADTFEPQKRGRAFGFTAVGWSVGAMLGILLGGVLTTFVGWRYIFYINVPIGIIATYFCLKYIRDNPKVNSKIDWLGMAALTLSLAALSYGAIAMSAMGVTNATLAIFLAGLVVLGIFFFLENRSANPLLNLHLFKYNRVLTFSVLAAFFMSLGYLGVVFILTMYLQGIRGLNPLDAALLLVPGYIVTSLVGPRMGRLSDKYGARILATGGLILIMCAVLIYLTLSAVSNVYIILVASFIAGIGTSMFFPANSSAIMANADPQHFGAISGLSRFMQNLGTLSSYVIIFTIATLAVSREVAFNVFIGTSKLIGGVSTEFLGGIHASLEISFFILLIAAILSFMRGKDDRVSHGSKEWLQKK